MMKSSLFLDSQRLSCEAKIQITVEYEDGSKLPVDVKVSSEGILELYQHLMSTKPLPPRRFLVVKADSPEGKELGLAKDELQIVPDYADAEYVQEMEMFNLDMMLQILGHAVVLPKRVAAKLKDPEMRIQYLVDKGLTIAHMTELFEKVLQLGTTAEENAQSYLMQQTGLTKEVLNKIQKRARKHDGGSVTPLFNKISLMKEFGIDVASIAKSDQDAITFVRLLQNHFEAEALEKQEKDRKQKANIQRTESKMPSFSDNRGFNAF